MPLPDRHKPWHVQISLSRLAGSIARGQPSCAMPPASAPAAANVSGCIFIVDPDTPPLADPARLNLFEPKLIKDVQDHIGARTKSNIGTLHVIEIK